MLGAMGVVGFGAVLSWWAVSMIAWRPPSWQAVLGAIAGGMPTVVVVALVAGTARLPFFGMGAAVGATVEIVFLAAAAGRFGRKEAA